MGGAFVSIERKLVSSCKDKPREVLRLAGCADEPKDDANFLSDSINRTHLEVAAATEIHTAKSGCATYGFVGIAPGAKRSERSCTLAASARYGPT